MSWPTTSAGYSATGITTIRWGTDGALDSPKPASGYYVVTKFSEKQLVESIKLSNGTGITSTRILLTDGVDWNITVRDDTTMTAPTVGTQIKIVDAGNLVPSPNTGTALWATVVDSNYETAPKQAGERTITVERLRLIEG